MPASAGFSRFKNTLLAVVNGAWHEADADAAAPAAIPAVKSKTTCPKAISEMIVAALLWTPIVSGA
jgi:hypothetical protein